jgi:hypothetical protein
MSGRVALIIFSLMFFAFAMVFMRIKENFGALLTEGTAQTIIGDHATKCAPIYKALNKKDEGTPFSREFRIQSSRVQTPGTCFIRKDDPLFADGLTSCDKGNAQLYDPQHFSNVIESIYGGQEIDPNHSSVAPSDVCYVTFNSNASNDQLVSYANYLNAQDPNVKALSSQNASCTTNLNAYQNMYARTSSALARSDALVSGYKAHEDVMLQQMSAMSNALADSGSDNIRVKDQLKSCSATTQAMNAVTASNQQLQKQVQQLSTSYASCENLPAEMAILRNNLDVVSQSNAALKSQLASLNAQHASSSSEASAQVSNLMATKKQLLDQVTDLQAQACGGTCVSTSAWNNMNTNTSSLQGQVSSLTSQLNSANAAAGKCALPGGSWAQSCSSPSFDIVSRTLSASCLNGAKQPVQTTAINCANAWNNNGKLICY